MKKILRVIAVLLLVGFILSTEQLPVRGWLLQELEMLALRHADKLPLAAIGNHLFDKHCARCHDDPAQQAPTRAALASLSSENLMIAMEFGKMQPLAAHLSKRQRGLIALYLAGSNKQQYQWIERARCTFPVGTDHRPRVSNWGLGIQNQRFIGAHDAGINRDNVASLDLAWSFVFPRVTDMRSQPVIIGDTLYVGDKAGRLYALDRFSGCVHRHSKILAGLRSAITLATLNDGRQLLIFANSLATVFAVEPSTLEIVWQRRVSISDYSIVTGSISFHNNRLFVPISSYEVATAGSRGHSCCTSHGAVTALNATNGKALWTWHATKAASERGKNSVNAPVFGPSGASVWTTPAIDPKRNRIYFGTGENLSHPATDSSDAIIALDMDSGEAVWKFQATRNDVWNSACLNGGPNCPENAGEDFDFGASVIIADLPDGRQVLLAGQKSGEVFALDPDPQGSEGQLIWRKRISQGTSNGGIHWAMALSGERLLVPVADPERDTAGYTPHPGLSALDIHSGEVLWQQAVERNCQYDDKNRPLTGLENRRSGQQQDLEAMYQCSFYYGLSAAVTVTPELVFSGGLDGVLRVYSTQDGELLWRTKTAVPFTGSNGIDGHGGAIDVAGQIIADGWLYVLSGYSMFGQLPGNVLLAYRVEPGA